MSSVEEERIGSVGVGGDGVIWLRGDLDVATAPDASAALAQHAHPEGRTVIDVGQVEFMDSSGLRVLLLAANAASRHGGTVVLRHPAPAVDRLLAFTGTAALFTIEPHTERLA